MQSDIKYIEAAYQIILGREIDESGLKYWHDFVDDGLDRIDLVNTLVASDEFKIRAKKRKQPIDILHNARQEWARSLPHFDSILDIGGSSATMPEGALIELGYLHRPKHLTIVDRPPLEQYHGAPSYIQGVHTFGWGVVEHIHKEAEALPSLLFEDKYDLVFMGQTIEHIQPYALPGILDFIKSVLKENGRLILDTPNRDITKIQSSNYIDSDHKKEYGFNEMVSLIVDAGFKLVDSIGMIEMSHTIASGNFSFDDFYDGELLNDDASRCYVYGVEFTL